MQSKIITPKKEVDWKDLDFAGLLLRSSEKFETSTTPRDSIARSNRIFSPEIRKSPLARSVSLSSADDLPHESLRRAVRSSSMHSVLSPFQRAQSSSLFNHEKSPEPLLGAREARIQQREAARSLLDAMVNPGILTERSDDNLIPQNRINKSSRRTSLPNDNKSNMVTPRKSIKTPPRPRSSRKKTPAPLSIERLKRTHDDRDGVDTRRNLDKRTARLRHSGEFSALIAAYQAESPAQSRRPQSLVGSYYRQGDPLSVFVRKRPIFVYEIERGEFDVIQVHCEDDCERITVHNCQMLADMQSRVVKPVSFQFTGTFDESCSNEEIYNIVGEPLLQDSSNGGKATLLVFGQTGSGKTYTMTGIQERVAKELFRLIPLGSMVSVNYVEICGNNVRDLLGDGTVKIADQVDGSVALVNATTVVTETARDLSTLFVRGNKYRATEATDKNGVSSRSHAICRVNISCGIKVRFSHLWICFFMS
jgi:hypothetical protein